MIFESRNRSDGIDRIDLSSSTRLTKTTRPFASTETKTSSSPVWSNRDTYASWKEQNYHRANIATSDATRDASPRRNVYSYTSYSREQDQTREKDKQRKPTSQRINDGTRSSEKTVKFTCSNLEDSYNLVEQQSVTRLSPSKKRMSRCVSGNAIPDTAMTRNEHLQMPYLSRFHPQVCSNYAVDNNNETVKTLLQLVNSQSEQIRNLQLQIDRLVRVQEEGFRKKSPCPCHSPSLVANRAFEYPSNLNYHDATVGSTIARCPSQDTEEHVDPLIGGPTVVEKENPTSVDETNRLETVSKPLEQQSKKAFMEQKVSIGVMTSFEFTVQNSPFLIEPEIYEIKEAAKEDKNINARNVSDASDSTKRYKTTFARKPVGTGQLENIVEDSESHLSSSRQQSSNFNASSMRDSERHTPRQSNFYNVASALESCPRMYQRPVADFTRQKVHEERNDMNERLEHVSKISDVSANHSVDRSCTASANYSKTPVVGDTVMDGYTMATMATMATMDGRESNGKPPTADARSSSHAFNVNVHSPATDCRQVRKNQSSKTRDIQDIGDSVVLSGGDLRVIERPPPTPEPSIHVDMQEYTSDDESDRLKRTSKIGWTFYNNVLGQVNEILQNSSITYDKEQNDAKVARNIEQGNDAEAKTALDTVKAATLEQLRRLGISLTETNEHGESNSNDKTLDFDSSFYPRLDRQANMVHTRSVVTDTNTSMHMKALALKYLSDEQLADIALHKQESSSLKHLLLSNMEGTNMSYATMRYLERYQLLPGKNNIRAEDTDGMQAPKSDPKNSPALRRFPFVQTPRTNCPNRILDLSTLKRQPKLL